MSIINLTYVDWWQNYTTKINKNLLNVTNIFAKIVLYDIIAYKIFNIRRGVLIWAEEEEVKKVKIIFRK